MNRTLIVFLLIASYLFGNGKFNEVDQQIMNLALNYEFEKSDKLLAAEFNSLEDLKNHFLYLNVELVKVIKETDEVSFSKKRALKDSLNQKLINYAEEVVEKYEDDNLSFYDRFYLGSIHGLLGRLYGVSHSWTSAFSSGKEGRNIMLDLIEEDPNFIDAYLLPGMLNYYTDRLGGVTEFMASILGLSGDRNIGLDYLEKVEKAGTINKWQATMILIELYSRMEGNKFEAIPLLEKMVKRFPKNSKFVNWLCYEYMNLHEYKKAGKLIEDDDNKQINDFVKANYFHGIGEYEKSNEIYSVVLNETDNTWPWVYENSKFTRVINFYYLNDSLNAEKYSKELNERYTPYIEIIEQNRVASKKINSFAKAVNLDDNVFAKDFIVSYAKFEESKFIQSQYYYYQAVMKFKNNDFQNAEKLFIKSKNINPEDYGENASQYLIHIYKERDVNIEKVEKLLDDIDEYDNERLEFFAQDLEEKYDL